MHYSSIVTDDLQSAEQWWYALSPRTSAFDDWDFRRCFAKHMGVQNHFYCVLRDGQPQAFLPLQTSRATGNLESFGGSPMEENCILWNQQDPESVRAILDSLPQSFTLQYCCNTFPIPEGWSVQPHAQKFILGLDTVSPEQYLGRFSAKSRHHVRSKIQSIEDLHPRIFLGGKAEVETMIHFNIRQFGNDSSFHIPGRKEAFLEFSTLPSAKILCCSIHDALVGVWVCACAYGTYAYLNSGVNLDAYPNLGTYLILKNMEFARSLGVRLFDACAYSFQWKERMHLDRQDLWELTRS